MGTDIHLWVEKKSGNGWEIVKGIDYVELDFYTKALEENREKSAGSYYSHLDEEYLLKRIEETKQPQEEWAYNGRNYNLFAILADVRNGIGFAGIKTGEGFNPISKPRGVPKDASDYYLQEVDYWDGDGHSHSYHTLKQLKEYDWNQETVQYGVIPENYYKELKESGENPEMWSGEVSGRNIKVISSDEMDRILEGTLPREEGIEYYVQMKWGIKYHETCGSFYDQTIPALEELSEDGVGEDVRIVFFFDN